MRLALEVLTLVIGAVAVLLVFPRSPKRPGRKPRQAPRGRPQDLERLEHLVVGGRSSAADAHVRIRPVLRGIASARLSRRGVRLDRRPDLSQALLGEELWELVRPNRPRPADPRGPGISLDELERMTERLERT